MKKLFLLLLLCFFVSTCLPGQAGFDRWKKIKENVDIKPFVMFQLWSTYSTGQERFNRELGVYEPVGARFNTQIRRGRLGFRVQAYEDLKFTMVGAYDLLGRDVLSSTLGGGNNGSQPRFFIIDAFASWRLSKQSEAFYLTGGYFRPQLGRESITSGWSVTSMEKAQTQFYYRQHLTGPGPGRTVGVNLGGLLGTEGERFHINYNLGIFNPVYIAESQNSLGRVASPLLTGRAVLHFGMPEMTSYLLGYKTNYFGDRYGLSVGLGGSYQNETNLFDASYSATIDLLFNWGPLNIDGEWDLMWREGTLGDDNPVSFTYFSETRHLRLSYNLVLGKKYFLEPVVMVMQFNGAQDEGGRDEALEVGAFSGLDRTYDFGLNWYLNKRRFKVLLHYIWNNGDLGAAEPGARLNQYFRQSALTESIRRGNWLGLGLHLII